jgi:putative acetyltransferase
VEDFEATFVTLHKTVTIERIQRAAQFEQFRDLQVAYEESLPADLRHSLPDLAGLESLYAEPNAAFLGLVDDNAAGCVAVTTLDPSSDILKRLYVDPAFRNVGLARALVNVALQFSREHERLRVVLDTDRERLAAAYKLYVSLGFQECTPYGPVDYARPTYMELRIR